MFGLLDKLHSGGVGLGMATRSGPSYVRHYAGAGMDFLVADLMHGPMGWTEMSHISALARGDGVYPFVRLPGHPWGSGAELPDRRFAADALKSVTSGAEGVIWSVASADEARSVAHVVDDWHQGKPVITADDVADVEREVAATRLLVPLVETPSAIGALPEILAIDGVAGVWMGLTDLSHQLGHAHHNDHPEVMRALSLAVDAAEARGKFVMANVGYSFDTVDKHIAAATRLIEAGARLVMLATMEFQLNVAARTLREGLAAWTSPKVDERQTTRSVTPPIAGRR